MLFLRQNFLLLILLIALISAAMHFRIFTTDIIGPHAWRQTQTVANIQYFARNDFNILHPQTHVLTSGSTYMRMEFPLLQWSIAGAFRVFGEQLWLLRFLLFTTGIVTLAGMGRLAHIVFGRAEAAPLAAWTLCFSPMFYYYSMNPLPDLLALCCAVWGLYFFFAWRKSKAMRALLCCVLFLAVAALCKLPFLIFYGVFAGWLWDEWKSKNRSPAYYAKVIAVVMLSVAAPALWYFTVMKEWAPNMVTSGMLHNELPASAIFGILWGSLVSTLPEFLLNYCAVPFFLAGAFRLFRDKKQKRPGAVALLVVAFAALLYFLFELNAITLIHDYYLMPFLPLLFLAVTYGVLKFLDGPRWMRTAAIVLLIAMPLAAFLRSDSRWNADDPGFNADLLRYKNELRAATPDDAKIILGHDESAHIGLYYADREGWNFHEGDPLTAEQLRDVIQKGARYLYSDSRTTENDPALQPFFGDTTAVIGSYHIIALRVPAEKP
jgi:4-amino-4-deoxy-L-arabinose transferase-like glycosyltransferase